MAALLATGCGGSGGGGGGGGDDDDTVEFLLTQYEYAITNPAGAPAPVTRTLVTPGEPNDVYSVDAGTGSMRGLFTVSSGDLTIADTTVYTANWSEGGPTPGAFSVAFTAAGSLASGNFLPASGAFTVTWGGDTISVQYGASVVVALNGGPEESFTPAEFTLLDVPGGTAPDWQRVAARASRALVDSLNQMRGSAQLLGAIYDGAFDDGEEVSACDSIPGLPPGGIGQDGEIVTTALGGGDYRTTATDCFNQSSDTAGILLTGTIERRNLVSVADADGAIVRAGFVGSPQASGGISYTTRIRLMFNQGVWTFSGNETLVSGGHSIEFTEP